MVVLVVVVMVVAVVAVPLAVFIQRKIYKIHYVWDILENTSTNLNSGRKQSFLQTGLKLGYMKHTKGVSLWRIGYWDCRFESRLGNGCLSAVSLLCVSVKARSLVQRSSTECVCFKAHQ